MMKKCICTHPFRKLSLEDTLAILEDLGFKYFEASIDYGAHIYPYIVGRKNRSELKDVLSSYTTKLAVIGGFSDFAVCDALIEKHQNFVKRQIEFANEFGVSILRAFITHLHKRYLDSSIRQRIVKNIRDISRVAEDFGVKIAFENEPGNVPEDIIPILENVNNPYIGVTFDPANFLASGVDPIEAGRKIAPYLLHVHLKDCIRIGRQIEGDEFQVLTFPRFQLGPMGVVTDYAFVEFGQGIMDQKTILLNLKELGYEGFLSLEYVKTEDVVRGTLTGKRNLEKLSKMLNISLE